VYCKSATRVLQECYTSVTKLLQNTRVLQECHKGVERVLQKCYKSVTENKSAFMPAVIHFLIPISLCCYCDFTVKLLLCYCDVPVMFL
jgi:hypothetical protein